MTKNVDHTAFLSRLQQGSGAGPQRLSRMVLDYIEEGLPGTGRWIEADVISFLEQLQTVFRNHGWSHENIAAFHDECLARLTQLRDVQQVLALDKHIARFDTGAYLMRVARGLDPLPMWDYEKAARAQHTRVIAQQYEARSEALQHLFAVDSRVAEGMIDRYGDLLPAPPAQVPPRPFEMMTVYLGAGLALAERGDEGNRQAIVTVVALVYSGHDVLSFGNKTEWCEDQTGPLTSPVTRSIVSNGVWEPDLGVLSYVTCDVLDYLNDHHTRRKVSRPTPGMQLEANLASKKTGIFVPPPRLYTVRLPEGELSSYLARPRPAALRGPLEFRHDRRGHERAYIHRGPQPLSEKDRMKYASRGYTICEERPHDQIRHAMAARGMEPRKPGEWLAIKTRWIDEQVVGPRDAPYVPAMRIGTKAAT